MLSVHGTNQERWMQEREIQGEISGEGVFLFATSIGTFM